MGQSKGGNPPTPGEFGPTAGRQMNAQFDNYLQGVPSFMRDKIRNSFPGMSGSGSGGFYNAATPNQTNAFGVTSGYSQNPDGSFNQTSSFGGPLGQAAQGYEQQLAATAGTPLDNGAQARQRAEDAIYGRETSRLDPRFQQEQEHLQTQLANQGLPIGSEAYTNAMGDFGRYKNDAYQQAQYGAITGGGQEASRQQQMDMNARFAPEQGLAGLAGLTGQSQNSLLPAALAQYQGALQRYGIDQAGKNSQMSGLTNLGGDLAMYAAMG